MKVHFYDKRNPFFAYCDKYVLGMPLSTCKDWVTCKECVKKHRIRMVKK